jgi:hypothetical protein
MAKASSGERSAGVICLKIPIAMATSDCGRAGSEMAEAIQPLLWVEGAGRWERTRVRSRGYVGVGEWRWRWRLRCTAVLPVLGAHRLVVVVGL